MNNRGWFGLADNEGERIGNEQFLKSLGRRQHGLRCAATSVEGSILDLAASPFFFIMNGYIYWLSKSPCTEKIDRSPSGNIPSQIRSNIHPIYLLVKLPTRSIQLIRSTRSTQLIQFTPSDQNPLSRHQFLFLSLPKKWSGQISRPS